MTGELDTLTYSHDDMNRLLSISGTKAGAPHSEAFEYDLGIPGVGNMTKRTVGVADTHFAYDRLNRLTSVSKAGTLSTYVYAGPSWMRTSATVGGVKTSYTYDGFACLRQSTGGISTEYATPGGAALWEITNGTATSFGTDRFGSVTARVGPGGIGSESKYDAFGNPTLTSGSLPVNHASTIGYRGQLVDRATKQVYLRNRFYSPDIGRFTRSDPAGAGHAYAYAGNDPVNNWDPSGLDYIKTSGDDVYWVIERDGWTYDEDVRELRMSGDTILYYRNV